MFHQGYSRQQILLGNPRGRRSTYKTKGRLRRGRRCLNGLCGDSYLSSEHEWCPEAPRKAGRGPGQGMECKGCLSLVHTCKSSLIAALVLQ
jgi:hypothetical protein